MKALIIVIDGFGIGEMPDSHLFGDVGSNTYKNILQKVNLHLPNLERLGLNHIDGVNVLGAAPCKSAVYARLAPKAPAKDTTAGHYEIAGLILDKPYKTYKEFPPHIIRALEERTGVKFIGNIVASGTEIINILGDEHTKTKNPIIYTSADSVMQIAANTQVIPLDKLYSICKVARKLMMGEDTIGRIIARPFIKTEQGYVRTSDRRDYALSPPRPTMLDVLVGANINVLGIGKINDIFNGQGITTSQKTVNNADGIQKTLQALESENSGLIFVNLVDTDMLYGHRNDILGYAKSLKEFDDSLPQIISKLSPNDLLIITADHGCDPTTPSTDHSREYVPYLMYTRGQKGKNLGTINGLDIISKTILKFFKVN